MGYLKIPNLYRVENIMLDFRWLYALEKIHGTSAHVSWGNGKVSLYSGGAKHSEFESIFDHDSLAGRLAAMGSDSVTVYGEAYGGKMQKMRDTYGDRLRFVAFDVRIGDRWLDVPTANAVVNSLGLEFVSYHLVSTDLQSLDAARKRCSVQALRNGCGDRMSEGVVLRPRTELTMNNGSRVIAKYKNEEFRETRSPRVVGEGMCQALKDAREIADEWVTDMRMTHVLDKMPGADSERFIPAVIAHMVDDIRIEGEGEVKLSKEAKREIGKKTALMFKRRLTNSRDHSGQGGEK